MMVKCYIHYVLSIELVDGLVCFYRSEFGGRPPSARAYRPPSGTGMRPASGARGRGMVPPSCILVYSLP